MSYQIVLFCHVSSLRTFHIQSSRDKEFQNAGIFTSAGHLCWIYRQLIGMSYIALARQVQIYRNISDPIGRLGSWSFWYIVLQLAKHYTPLQCIVIHRTAEKNRKVGVAETINIWTNLRRHLLLPAAPIQLKFLCSALAKTIFAFVVIICGPLWLTYLLPQVFDVLKHIFVKYIGNISGVALDISLLNISAIYRD